MYLFEFEMDIGLCECAKKVYSVESGRKHIFQ